MLSKLITKVNRRILYILLEEKASLSEIARKSRTTKANVFNSLKSLEKEDIVRKEIKGKTHLFRLNFLHPEAGQIMRFFLEERKNEYSRKMGGLPGLLNSLLENILKKKYQGCLFFGSSLEGEYKDIDVFVMAEGAKTGLLNKEAREINEKVSLVLGTRKELEKGIKEEDMLYKNILLGIPFSCEDFVLKLRQRRAFLRKKDIRERFILGYREILSCREFKEKEYAQKHLGKGAMDVTYAALNYLDIFPKDDYQAKEMFKKQFGFIFSGRAGEAKRQAEKIGEIVL